MTYKTALTIAGFDPSAGAGILADLKTFHAHGVFAQAAVTGWTVQSTQGVSALQAVDPVWLRRSLTALMDDNSFSVIKIGALFSSKIVKELARFLNKIKGIPVVCDPVLASSSGAQLLDSKGADALKRRLLPVVDWLTPNREELSFLTGAPVDTRARTEAAARRLQRSFPQMRLVVTGGACTSPDDLLLMPGSAPQWIAGKKIQTSATHGTGCTFASALAARLVLYPDERPARRVAACKRYVEGAMRGAPVIGRGAGPLNHFWRFSSNATTEREAKRRLAAASAAASGATSTKRRI